MKLKTADEPSPLTPELLVAFRHNYGFTQQELGDAIGMNRGYISAVEQGYRSLTDHLAVPVASFISFVEECDRDGRL